MYVVILSFLTAFTLTYFAIPPIISVAREKNLCDVPGERSSHTISTPSLGGIGIFAGAIFSIVLWTPFNSFSNLQYILCAFLILFLIGAKDDLSPVSPDKKIIGQVLAAAILIFKSDIQLNSFYGLFGLEQSFPEWLMITLSIFTIMVIVNAFNLIDGINGLAGSIGALICATLGSWFLLVNHLEFAILAFTTMGAIMAFLKYNYTPAKIFMGDTGSLMIGLACAILVIKFIDLNHILDARSPYKLQSGLAVAIGIMILPLYDTIRVFTTRIIRGRSPFAADRRHIHHLLIDYGLTHMQATTTLVFINILFITLAFSLHDQLGVNGLILVILSIASFLTYYLHQAVLKKKKYKQATY